MSQEDLAHDAGITAGSLSRIEGAVSNPTWTTVERLARALGITLAELGAEIERIV
jgi:transcriptional regulator with XRE-family HTH domain